jgi:Delta3-Delta2-enoyl-CoA isomerase
MPFQHVRIERDASVAILRFASGKLNALSPELIEESHRALDALEADPLVRGLVITGGDSRFFSYGLDVARLLTLDRVAMEPFMESFNRLVSRIFLFPRPVGAAVNGHATAGGLLLTVAADCRVGAEGSFSLGLSEVNLGLAAPAGALRMMARRLGASIAARLALEGVMIGPGAARDLGIFEAIVPPERLLPETLDRVRRLAEMPAGGIALNKQFLGAGVYDLPPEVLRQEASAWLDRWFSAEAQEKLRDLVARK